MLKTGDLANDTGTVLVGVEAVDNGIIDEVGDLKVAMDKLLIMIKERKDTEIGTEKFDAEKSEEQDVIKSNVDKQSDELKLREHEDEE